MNKQWVCCDTGKLEIQEEPIPEPEEDGLIIKVEFAGICHTDSTLAFKEEYRLLLPRVLGHEIGGSVYKLGTSYTKNNLALGDKVVVYPWVGCDNCDYCKTGQGNLCHTTVNPPGKEYGIYKNGGFQEYLKIDEAWCVVPVPKELPLHIATVVPCSGITAWNALKTCKESITRAIQILGHANLYINGCGGLGHWALQMARSVYKDKVTILAGDISEFKVAEAIKAGANHGVLLHREDSVSVSAEKIKKCIAGEGVHAAIDMVNTDITLQIIFYSLANGGTIALVGLTEKPLPPLNNYGLLARTARLQGIYAGTKQDISEVFELLKTAEVKGPDIEFVRFDEVKSTLNKMNTGSLNVARAVVQFSKQ